MKTNYQIKTITDRLIFEGEHTSFIECIEDAVRKDLHLSYTNLTDTNLSGVNLSGVNLSGAKLIGVNLTGANLSGVNLSGAKLSGAKLIGVNLTGAKLTDANFTNADCSCANLQGANIDYSCLPLWCGSLKMKTDEKIRKQIGFHFASLIANANNATDEEKQILEYIKDYVNGFHRCEIDVKKIK